MYDAVEERIAAYEKEILRKLGEMEREEHRSQIAPPLQNKNKARMINNPAQEPKRRAFVPNEWRRASTRVVADGGAFAAPQPDCLST